MKFSEIVDQASGLLQRKGRITYRALKLEFSLTDEQLDVLTEELIDGQQVAIDEGGKVLVCKGTGTSSSLLTSTTGQPQAPVSYTPPHLAERIRAEQAALEARSTSDGERKTITALFADLKGSTALIAQEKWAEGIVQVRQGLEAQEGETLKTGYLAWLAEGYGGAGQIDEGLATVAEALRLVDKNDERFYEAELYRLYGELSLRAGETANGRTGEKSEVAPSPDLPIAPSFPEACFLKAVAIAQKQHAKSLELRAVISLAKLWQTSRQADGSS